MTRAHLFALLALDNGFNIFHYPESQWLSDNGLIGDDGCELFVTMLGDRVINDCVALLEEPYVQQLPSS